MGNKEIKKEIKANKEIKDRNWWRNWSENRVDIVKFKKESENICYYCGKKITSKDDLTVDHVVPVSKGGENAKDNFVISCKACNREKSNLSVERYAEFLNIIKAISDSSNMLESIEKAINGLKEIIIGFNGEIYAMKTKLAAAEKKRAAVLESMMFKKFNVVQGYDYARELRSLTEEIYNLKLNISQMNKIQARVNQISPFINNANPKGIKKEAVNEMRAELISDYYVFKDEKPDAPPESGEPPADIIEPEEQTG